MRKRSFKQAFNAIFHDEESFDDFMGLDLGEEVSEFNIDGRTVFKTSDKLKKYLRFIDRVMFRHLAKNERVVHSFTKGRSTLSAVRSHSSSKYFFLSDIKDFYQNIKAQDVRRILIRDSDLIPISDFNEYIDAVVEMTSFGAGLPVGFVTSPQLSNAFLYEFDNETERFCVERSLSYTRYADDIIISGGSIEDISDLKNYIPDILKRHASINLVINERKTHITQQGNRVKILGLIVLPNGKITINPKHKKNIESLIYFYINDKVKYVDFLDKTFGGNERSLFGLLHYANSIDPDYIEKLQRKYGSFVLRLLMEGTPGEHR